jgi:hypothetical protein
VGAHLLARQSAAVGAIAAAVLAGGCGSSNAPPASAPDRTAVAAGLAVLFPSAAYRDDGRTIASAEQRLLRRCMGRRGFAYPAAELPTDPPGGAVQLPDRRGYGLRRGFRGVAARTLVEARDPARGRHAALLRSLPAERRRAYLRALEGTPATGTGCADRATARLYGGLERYRALVIARNAVAQAVGAALDADRRLRQAMARWRACMADYRLPHATPAHARLAVYDAYLAGTPAAAQERRTARADRACGIRSGIYAETRRVATIALRALPNDRLRALHAFAAVRADAARRAHDRLTGPRHPASVAPRAKAG